MPLSERSDPGVVVPMPTLPLETRSWFVPTEKSLDPTERTPVGLKLETPSKLTEVVKVLVVPLKLLFPLKVLAPENVLLLARSVVEATVMELPAVSAVPLMVPRVPVRRLAPIDVVATTWPEAFTPRTELARLARVSWPALLNDDVAEPPKYAGPYDEKRVVEANPVDVRFAKFAVPVNVGDAESTTLPEPVEDVTPVPPLATATMPVTFAAVPVVFWLRVGISPETIARHDGAPLPLVGPAKKKFCDVDVRPVPPLEIGKVPVTPVVSGRPVALVSVPLDGVPSAPPKVTKAPEEPTLVPSAVATPVPRPLTPVEMGRPVPLVRVTAEGVPRLGVVSAGLVERTIEPVPVTELLRVTPP
jgi:hypothetical protein